MVLGWRDDLTGPRAPRSDTGRMSPIASPACCRTLVSYNVKRAQPFLEASFFYFVRLAELIQRLDDPGLPGYLQRRFLNCTASTRCFTLDFRQAYV